MEAEAEVEEEAEEVGEVVDVDVGDEGSVDGIDDEEVDNGASRSTGGIIRGRVRGNIESIADFGKSFHKF